MTNEQAKKILQLYRPGSADATDPEFAEALAACEHDAELAEWFNRHCAVYVSLRSKFKGIPIPEGLREQIIAERPVKRTTTWQKAVLLAGAVAVAVMAFNGFRESVRPAEPHDFASYRIYMASAAQHAYGMDVTTNDLDQIRTFFSRKDAIADYVLPQNLQSRAQAAGCVATTWQGKRVSMICFQTGRPLAPGQQSDLWLFISDRTIATDAPQSNTPAVCPENGLITASWTTGNRTYVLATVGDAPYLAKFLPATTPL